MHSANVVTFPYSKMGAIIDLMKKHVWSIVVLKCLWFSYWSWSWMHLHRHIHTFQIWKKSSILSIVNPLFFMTITSKHSQMPHQIIWLLFQRGTTSADKVNKFCLYFSRCKDKAYDLFVDWLQSSGGQKHIAVELKQLEKIEYVWNTNIGLEKLSLPPQPPSYTYTPMSRIFSRNKRLNGHQHRHHPYG